MSRRTRKTKANAAPPKPGSIADFAARYLKHQAVVGLAQTTLSGRRGHLRRFAEWAESRGVETPVAVTLQVLVAYQHEIYEWRTSAGRPVSASTQFQHLVSIRQLFAWLTKQGYLAADPAAALDLPARRASLPAQVLTVEQAERVLSKPDVTTPTGVRDRAILELLFSSGLRRAELLAGQLCDLNFSAARLHVRQGKGGTERIVPVGKHAIAWLRRYVDEVRSTWVRSPTEQHLFLAPDGAPMTAFQASMLGSDYLKAADLHIEGSALHVWRHTGATAMLESGADVRFIQDLLGHKSIRTTQVYTRVAIGKLQRVHAKTHPRG